MKLLKWSLGSLMLVGVLFVVGGLLLPARTHVERSVLVERPAADVFRTLNSFQRFNEWSPWFAADPQAKYSYDGPGEGVGARMAWSGNRAVGSGSQEIIESHASDRIVVALDFGGSMATATYRLVAQGDATQVTWSFDTDHGFNPLERWFGLMFEQMIGNDYESGLARLKTMLEQPGTR